MSPTKKKVTASGELRVLKVFYFVCYFAEFIRLNKADKSLLNEGLLYLISRPRVTYFPRAKMITPIPESR